MFDEALTLHVFIFLLGSLPLSFSGIDLYITQDTCGHVDKCVPIIALLNIDYRPENKVGNTLNLEITLQCGKLNF